MDELRGREKESEQDVKGEAENRDFSFHGVGFLKFRDASVPARGLVAVTASSGGEPVSCINAHTVPDCRKFQKKSFRKS